MAVSAELAMPAAPAWDFHAYPPRRNCVQVVASPFGGFTWAGAAGTEVIWGWRCRFTSLAGGGYRAQAGFWLVTVTTATGERRLYGSKLGNAPCGDVIIRAGEQVEIESDGVLFAGEHADCG